MASCVDERLHLSLGPAASPWAVSSKYLSTIARDRSIIISAPSLTGCQKEIICPGKGSPEARLKSGTKVEYHAPSSGLPSPSKGLSSGVIEPHQHKFIWHFKISHR